MAVIKVTLPLGEVPVMGKQVSFKAPCTCTEAEAIQIDGVNYTVCDALGRCVTGSRGVWEAGEIISVILDTESNKALIQNGATLTRDELLSAETAALFGLGADAVPNDAFAWVGKYNQHWWKYRANGWVLQKGEVNDVVLSSGTTTNNAPKDVTYSDNVLIDADTGAVSLMEPTSTVTGITNSTYTKANVLAGKYFIGPLSDNAIYYADPSATAKKATATLKNQALIPAALVTATVDVGEWGYLRSANGDAYPHSGKLDGYEYEYLGVPFDNAVDPPLEIPNNVESGTYVGTDSSPASLTFSGTPLVVFVSVKVSANNYMWGAVGQQSGISIGSTSSNSIHLSTFSAELDGNTLTWGDESYNTERSGSSWSTDTSGASYHELLNSSSNTYHYCALTV